MKCFNMRKLKKFFDWLFAETEYNCSDCKIKMDTYGSEPWGYFYYVCPKCKTEKHPMANER